ncbi:MAG TPA: hypothetical protein VEK11_04685 [Thermoanaerobaculia bacterium]|nr:hypothetical protein [Thermoanaerobaculia bacterium]
MVDRATHRTIVMHRITPDLKAGVEWNARANEVGIVANWRALDETATRPALIFGTSSDRIGTPSGQSYYATLSKSLPRVPVAPYAGVSWSGYEERFVFPFGVNAALGKGWSAMLINDGVHTHLSATYGRGNFSITALAVERRHFGITVGTTF